MVFPDFRGTDRTTSQPEPRALKRDVDGGAEDPQLWHVSGTGYFDVFFDSEREIAVVVEAGIVDLVRDRVKGSSEELTCLFAPKRYDRSYGFAFADSPVLDRLLRKLGSRGLVGKLREDLLRLL